MDKQLKAEAQRLHAEGLSAQQIANRLAIDIGPVWRTIYGSQTAGKTPEDQLWDDVRQLFIEGRTPQDIADGLNLDLDIVNKWIYTDGAFDRPSSKGDAKRAADAVVKRTLDWWESQYRSKLADLAAGPDRQRPMPTPEELLYFEDKIRELGGNPKYAKDLLWLDLQNEIVKEICPELDRTKPSAKPVRARRKPKFHVFHAVSAVYLALSAMYYFALEEPIVAAIWLMSATMMFLAAGVARRR